IPTVWQWLTCRIVWEPTDPLEEDSDDNVTVSFHFAPLQNQFQAITASSSLTTGANVNLDFSSLAGDPNVAPNVVHIPGEVEEGDARPEDKSEPLPNYGEIWDQSTRGLQQDTFALLDVSTKADLFGISFGSLGGRRMVGVRTFSAVGNQSDQGIVGFPLQVRGMDVVSQGFNVRTFTVPQISWEPAFNLTAPPQVAGDPLEGFNYYPDDGGSPRIINNGGDQVALAPIPLTDFLVETYARENDFAALALFTLSFGLRALSLLKKEFKFGGAVQRGTDLTFDS